MDPGKGHAIRPQHFHQYPGWHSRILCGRSAGEHSEHSSVRLLSHSRGRNHRRNPDSVRVASRAQSDITPDLKALAGPVLGVRKGWRAPTSGRSTDAPLEATAGADVSLPTRTR